MPYALGAEYFGLRFEKTLRGGVHYMTESYITKVLALERPKNKAELRTAEGIIGFIESYIPNAAQLRYYLNVLLRSLKEEKSVINWENYPEAAHAWIEIRNRVKKQVKLNLPQRGKPFAVVSDSSQVAYGGVLVQLQYDKELGCDK